MQTNSIFTSVIIIRNCIRSKNCLIQTNKKLIELNKQKYISKKKNADNSCLNIKEKQQQIEELQKEIIYHRMIEKLIQKKSCSK